MSKQASEPSADQIAHTKKLWRVRAEAVGMYVVDCPDDPNCHFVLEVIGTGDGKPPHEFTTYARNHIMLFKGAEVPWGDGEAVEKYLRGQWIGFMKNLWFPTQTFELPSEAAETV